MPGIIVKDRINVSSLSGDLLKRLEMLEEEISNDAISKKEYCDKKWSLLKAHADSSIIKQIQQLQDDLESTNIIENDYCSEVMNILQEKLNIHSPVKGNGRTLFNEATSPKLSGSPKTYGRPTRSSRSKPEFVADDQVAGPSRTPKSAAKKLAAFKASPRNGDSGRSTRESSKRKAQEIDNVNGTSKTTSAKKLALENEESMNGSVPKDTGKKSNGKENGQKNTLSSWIKKGSSPCNGDSTNSTQVKDSQSEVETEKMSDNEHNTADIGDGALVKEEPEEVQDPKIDIQSSDKLEIKVETEEITNDDDEDSRPLKKLKTDNNNITEESKDSSSSKSEKKPTKVVPAKCETCRQLLSDSDLRLYPGHPHDAVEEFVALTDPKLSLFTGDEGDINEHDERPQNKVTQFSVYDKAGHLCPIDGGLVERNVYLYFSGYMKPIYEESADIEGGIPTKDMGPINEWWVSGFDGGEKALIGFSTAFGEYYLMEPSEAYAPLMESVKEKIYMSKLVIEFLLDEENASYEDLLNKLQTTVPPFGTTTLTEDSLLRHAQFICDQVVSFDTGADNHEDLLVTSPCMRALIQLAGVTFGKR